MNSGTLEAYDAFLATHPSGEYASQAEGQHEALLWEQVLAADREKDFTRYLERHPNGDHRRDAFKRRLDLRMIRMDHDFWAELGSGESCEGLGGYLQRYPEGEHAIEAIGVLSAITRAVTAEDLTFHDFSATELPSAGNQKSAKHLEVRYAVTNDAEVPVSIGVVRCAIEATLGGIAITASFTRGAEIWLCAGETAHKSMEMSIFDGMVFQSPPRLSDLDLELSCSLPEK